VAVLLEMARALPPDGIPTWLVFFDAEDNGDLFGRDWIMGSRAFVANLTSRPRAAIILDMVGDADLNIYIEHNSTTSLVTEIWGQASKLGYVHYFIQKAKYSMLDDHTPFLEAGIPAVDIIDFDYPYWHTSADTPDKVSPKSLKIVGDTLLAWMTTQK
jgi:glutaminyl-peptide cyclotransferase